MGKSAMNIRRSVFKIPTSYVTARPCMPVATVLAAADRQILKSHPSASTGKMETFSPVTKSYAPKMESNKRSQLTSSLTSARTLMGSAHAHTFVDSKHVPPDTYPHTHNFQTHT